ncbi:MAG: hypothetical protein ACTSP9_03095 [Promethearchaeota archaeon]
MICPICGKEYVSNDDMLHLLDLRLANLEGLVLKKKTEDEFLQTFADILVEVEKAKKGILVCVKNVKFAGNGSGIQKNTIG